MFSVFPIGGGWDVRIVRESEERVETSRVSMSLEVAEFLLAVLRLQVLYCAYGVDKIPLSR